MTQSCEITWTEKDGEHKMIITAESKKLFDAAAEKYKLNDPEKIPQGRALVVAIIDSLVGTSRKAEHYLNGQLENYAETTSAIKTVNIVGRDPSSPAVASAPAEVTYEFYHKGKRQDPEKKYVDVPAAIQQYKFSTDPSASLVVHAHFGCIHELVSATHYSNDKKKHDMPQTEVDAINGAARKKLEAEKKERNALRIDRTSGDSELVKMLLDAGQKIEERKKLPTEKVFGNNFKLKP